MSDKNYLTILCDACRYDYFLSAFFSNPTIAKLKQNMRFYTNMHSTSCWTIPAIGSLITQMFPLEHGAILLRRCKLRVEIPTIYDYMKNLGYNIFYVSANPMFDQTFLNRLCTQDKIVVEDKRWYYQDLIEHGALIFEKYFHQKLDCPFWGYIHLMDAHMPYIEVPNMFPTIRVMNTNNGWQEMYIRHVVLDEEASKQHREMYRLGVKSAIDGVVAIFEDLIVHGLLETTVVSILADHGECLGEQGHYNHQFQLLDCCTHIPCVIYDQENIKSLEMNNDLYSICDVVGLMQKSIGTIPRHETYAFYSATNQLTELNYFDNLRLVRPDLFKVFQKKIDRNGSGTIIDMEFNFGDALHYQLDMNEEAVFKSKLEALGYV